jgi:putative two-component system response regulator
MSEPFNVLIVDTDRTSLALLDMMVRKLPNCSTLLHSNPSLLLSTVDKIDYDLAIFSSTMPQINGVELAKRMRLVPHLATKPVVIATNEADAPEAEEVVASGVAEVLQKPIDPVEFRSRISRLAQASNQDSGAVVERNVTISSPELTALEEEFFTILARVSGLRDRETPLHNKRMARYCAIIARHLGLPADACRAMRLAAGLHDIGKAGLSDALLHKRGALTPEERLQMEEHTRIGHSMLYNAQSPTLRLAADVALNHHERWDGSGYPRRLKGEHIPLAGRIAAVADVFDALTSVRPYKSAWSRDNALRYMQENAGEKFDPACIAAFDNGQEEIAAVMLAMSDAALEEADADAD